MTLLLLLLFGAADAQAQNLVQNPGFDGSLSGWTPAPGMIFWDQLMGNSAPGSAGFFISSASPTGTNAFVAYQCIPATGGNTYDIRGSFRYASGSSAIPIGSLYVSSSRIPGASTSSSSLRHSRRVAEYRPANEWLTGNYPGGLVPPAGTAALRLILSVFTSDGRQHAGLVRRHPSRPDQRVLHGRTLPRGRHPRRRADRRPGAAGSAKPRPADSPATAASPRPRRRSPSTLPRPNPPPRATSGSSLATSRSHGFQHHVRGGTDAGQQRHRPARPDGRHRRFRGTAGGYDRRPDPRRQRVLRVAAKG